MCSGVVWCILLGTPCTGWVPARTTGQGHHPTRACVAFTAKVLRVAARYGVHIILENPARSSIFNEPEIARALVRLKAVRCDFDMCAYGAAWKKPTTVYTTLPAGPSLRRRCPAPGAPRVVLSGTVQLPGEKPRWRTAFASAYPPRLGAALARVCRAAATPSCFRRPREPILDNFWDWRLAVCTKPDADHLRRVAAPKLARTARLGWEGAVRHWDGKPWREELADFRAHRAACALAARREAPCRLPA